MSLEKKKPIKERDYCGLLIKLKGYKDTEKDKKSLSKQITVIYLIEIKLKQQIHTNVPDIEI